MTLPPDPAAPLRQAVRRRALLTRGVSAVTQLGTAFALTATGALVGLLGHQAQVADALRAGAAAKPPERVVVPTPVKRPVRTVVVRRFVTSRAAAPARVLSVPAVRRATATRRVSTAKATSPKRAAAPAPRPTQAPAATTTSGS